MYTKDDECILYRQSLFVPIWQPFPPFPAPPHPQVTTDPICVTVD